jgi:release factor glutamine methyltransferase
VPPDVQPITGVSLVLGEAVLAEVRVGDQVLDMGTGCGVNAVLAASRAGRVLAVDVNPVARELIAAAGLRAETIASESLVRDDWRVEYFVLRLSG